jgi:(2Fe-2S) ferredoxin
VQPRSTTRRAVRRSMVVIATEIRVWYFHLDMDDAERFLERYNSVVLVSG